MLAYITICLAGANVQKGRFLDTPLHAAAQKDCPEIVKVLLEFGANLNARNLELQRAVDTAPPSSLAECMLLHYEGDFIYSTADSYVNDAYQVNHTITRKLIRT